jgi:hypothetical protein
LSWRRAGRTWLLGLALVGGTIVAGCGGSANNQVPQYLTVEAQWNDSPSSVDQIGYQLLVDLVWQERQQGCFPLSPNLAIHINDDLVVAPPIEGDCAYESLVIVGGVQPQGATTISLQDGDQVLGEGIFAGLFPDAAATLTTPAAGQPVKAGDPIAVVLPAPSADNTLAGARFYWTDTPATVPPFYSWVSGTISTDGLTFQGTAPTTATGRATVVVESFFGDGDFISPTSCTGFQFCNATPSFEMAGPVSIEVVP